MGRITILQWESLERRSPTLFLAAGALLVGYAALTGLVAATGVAETPVENVLGPAGLGLGLLGLLGLYPGLVDRSPRLARVGAACAGLGAASFAVITAQGVAVLAGVEPPGLPGVLLLLIAVGMIPGYLSIGVATRRVAGGGRPVGLLLLIPGVVFAAMLSQPFVYGALGILSEATMAWSNFGISSAQAVAHLAIGYALRGRVARDARTVPAADATVG